MLINTYCCCYFHLTQGAPLVMSLNFAQPSGNFWRDSPFSSKLLLSFLKPDLPWNLNISETHGNYYQVLATFARYVRHFPPLRTPFFLAVSYPDYGSWWIVRLLWIKQSETGQTEYHSPAKLDFTWLSRFLPSLGKFTSERSREGKSGFSSLYFLKASVFSWVSSSSKESVMRGWN